MKANQNYIKVAMARACMDPNEIAIRANLSYPAVRRALDGCEVKPSTIGRIAKALNIDAEEIIQKED